MIDADAGKEVAALAERLSAPVVTQYLHNDAFPASHPLMCGPSGYLGSKAAMQILNQADVVMAIGTRLGPFGKTRQYDFDVWPTGARFIQFDVNHRVLGLTQDVELAIWGGARETVRLIFEQLGTIDHEVCSNTTRDDRMSRVQRLKDAWARELQEWTNRGPAGELSPRRALRELQRAMPERAASRPTWATSCPRPAVI